MIEVKLQHEKPMNILAIVAELKDSGLVLNTDFSFAFYPSCYNTETHEFVPKQTIFSFSEDKIATWFTLKYCI